MRVLVTGATGCIGRSILAHVGNTAVEIVASSPSAPLSRGQVDGIRWEKGDLRMLGEVLRSGLLPPVDAVINCAGLVHQRSPDPRLAIEVNVRQTLELARILAELRPGIRFVQVSTVAAARPREGLAAYGASKRQAEDALAQLGGLNLKVVRLTTTYGPGDRGNVGRLYRAIARGRYASVAPPDTLKSLLWASSAAAGLLAAATVSEGVSGCSTLADPEPYTLREIERALATAAGRPEPRTMPGFLSSSAAVVGTALEPWLGDRVPFSLRVLKSMRSQEVHPPMPPGVVTRAARAALRGDLTARFVESYRESNLAEGQV